MGAQPGIVELHRPARVQPAPVVAGVVSIPTPPAIPENIGNAVWQVLGPVLGSAGIIGFAIVSGDTRHLLLAGALAGAMFLTGLVGRMMQLRANRRRRHATAERYLSHLAGLRAELDRAAADQRRAIDHTTPHPTALPDVVAGRRRIWERRPHHDDFLHVRIGSGAVPALVTPQPEGPVDPLAVAEPVSAAAAERLLSETRALTDLGVVIDLRSPGVLAVTGDRSEAGRPLVRSIVAQLATFCSPNDVTVMAKLDEDDRREWEWLKWLPHTRGDDPTAVSVAITARDLDVLLAQIVDGRVAALERSRSSQHPEPLAFRPVLLIIDGYRPDSETGRLGRLETILADTDALGIIVICLVDDPGDVPATTGATIAMMVQGTADYREHDPLGNRIAGLCPDRLDIDTCDSVARGLAPLRVRSAASPTSRDATGLLSLLEEVPTRSGALCTPIGVGQDGTPLVLDLREASTGGIGPHGLIIGATGSGKSELLRTLVLGLAATNEPEDLALVLVDFKGGATFGDLGRLPHVAGMISNLESDPTLIDRMKEALFGELERRQRLLREAGIDRADVYRAHRRERRRDLAEPLPALLVVVDEFGELLTARPDFVELFSSIGRTGRSLGVHLLLAGQRLDEGRIRTIDGHLRYRICLRTFTPEESLAVLGSRCASQLPPVPGLGYLGVDGRLAQFKAAMASRPNRSMSAPSASTPTVRRFEITEASPTPPGGSTPRRAVQTDTTEMSVLLERLCQSDRAVRSVWLDPLPTRIDLTALGGRTGCDRRLAFPIGLVDDPRHQSQEVFTLDFSGAAGHLAVVGGPRSGKSWLLRSLIASVAIDRSPRDIQFYAIDLGGGTLHTLEDLPHVGAVLGRGNRQEIPLLIRQLAGLVEQRVEQFRLHGLTDMDAFEAARSMGTLDSDRGRVFLVIDNWAVLSQEYPTDLTDEIAALVTGGLHYGVHVIVTSGRWQDLRLGMRDAIGGRLEMRLVDPYESEIDRHAAASLPAIAGRAIDPTGRQLQVGAIDPVAVTDAADLRWVGEPEAPGIRMLPELVEVERLPSPTAGVALGIEESLLATWSIDLFEGDPHLLVLGDGPCGKTNLLRIMATGLVAGYGPEEVVMAIVDYRRRIVDVVAESHGFGVASTPDAVAGLVGRVTGELDHRLRADASTDPRLVVMVDDYDQVAGVTGNPLAPLVDYVARGADIGFHLVLTRRVAGLARAAFEPLLQRLREVGSPGLLMNGDPHEGPLLGGIRPMTLPAGRGIHVTRRGAVLVQTALASPPPARTGLRRVV